MMSETRSKLPCSCSCSCSSKPPPPPPPSPPKTKEPAPAPPEPLPPPPLFRYPYNEPVRRSSAAAASIHRVPATLRRIFPPSFCFTAPTAVSIGPYHRYSSPHLREMEPAKCAAVEHLCHVASQPREVIHGKMLFLVGAARGCYDYDVDGYDAVAAMDDGDVASMMLADGCFLLQFMASMCPGDPDAAPEAETDPLMVRPEVHSRVDAIARDVMLLENQLPWLVLEALMELFIGPAGAGGMRCWPVGRFLALMASAFDVGGNPADDQDGDGDLRPPPPPAHLLDLFHRRQLVGAARTQSLRVPRLSSLSCTAVELAEMGVNLVAGETKKFGDMAMSKRRRGLFFFGGGELSLAPVVLNELTMCWLVNLAAHEACLGFTRADNFSVSSYVAVVALLMNRRRDVQEMRAKGLVVSAFSDEDTLNFFKWLAPRLQVGHRYYDVFERLQEYRKERWLWIAVHKFLYKNIKTIIAVLSVVGVLAGLFKTILSLKQPDR